MELNNYLSKDTTQIIKGFAILFMIAHHVLIKEFYMDQPEILTNIFSIRLQIGMKMCVGLFTFFVGYGAFYAKELDIRYIYKHIWRLLKCYWLVLLVTILIAYISNVCYDMPVTLLNFVGLMSQYNLGSWYIYFYIYALLVLPFIARLLKQNTWTRLFYLIAFSCVASYFTESSQFILRALSLCFFYTPILAIGYACAQTQIIGTISKLSDNAILWFIILLTTVLLRCITGGKYGFSTDIVFVPLFILSVAVFAWGGKILFSKTLSSLGRNSMFMWFIHAIPLSDATRAFFQDSVLWTNNVLILYFVLVVVSYLLSVGLKNVLKKVHYL